MHVFIPISFLKKLALYNLRFLDFLWFLRLHLKNFLVCYFTFKSSKYTAHWNRTSADVSLTIKTQPFNFILHIFPCRFHFKNQPFLFIKIFTTYNKKRVSYPYQFQLVGVSYQLPCQLVVSYKTVSYKKEVSVLFVGWD